MHRMDLDGLINQVLGAIKENTSHSTHVEFDLCVGGDENEQRLKVYPAAGQSPEVSRIKFTIET